MFQPKLEGETVGSFQKDPTPPRVVNLGIYSPGQIMVAGRSWSDPYPDTCYDSPLPEETQVSSAFAEQSY